MELVFLVLALVLALVAAFFGFRTVEGRYGGIGFALLALAFASFVASQLVGNLPG